MKKSTQIMMMFILFVCCFQSNAQTVTWTDNFTAGVTPTPTQVSNWDTFKSNLSSTYSYTKMTISGTFDGPGQICTDPSIVLAFANALRTGATYTSPLTNGNIWSLCNRSGGEVWLNPPSECSGSNCPGPNGYIIRPGIGNTNWGGVNTNTCGSPSQMMSFVFEYASNPTITCPGNTTVSNDPGECGAVVTYTVTATDIEDGPLTPTQTAGLPSGATFPVGMTTNTFEVTDSDGNTSSCSFDVTVNDTEAPAITCPGDITQSNDPGECGAVVNYENSTITFSEAFTNGVTSPSCGDWNTFQSELLSGLNYTKLTIKGSNDPIGVSVTDPTKVAQLAEGLRTGVPVVVTDGGRTWQTGNCGSGNEISAAGSTCQCTGPEYIVRPCVGNSNWGGVNSVTCGGPSQTMIVEFEYNNGLMASDNCPGSTTVQTAGLPSGSTFPVGTTTNTFVVTDSAGLTATCSFDVTVNDTESPSFPNLGGDGSLSNPFISLLPEEVGNVSSGTYYFNFNGNTFQGELDNDNDGGGWLMILNYVHQAGDNSILQVRNTDLPLFGASILGTSEAASASWGHFGNILAADIDFEEMRFYGETTAHTRIIDFTTNYTPAIDYAKTGLGSFNGINNVANYTLLANHTSTIPQNAPNTFTNEGDFALTNFPFWRSGSAHWGIRGLGNRWEVDDFSNNSASTIHRIWVRGDLSPASTIESTSLTVQLDATGTVTVAATDFGLTATDNCSTPTLSLSQTSFSCADIGNNTIQLTATDAVGNTTIIDVNVTVEDNVDPVITCVANDSRDTNPGVCQYTIVGNEFDATFTDNCTNGFITNDLNGTSTLSGVVLPKGDTTVLWTADDGNGQTATCTTVITVEDNEDPVISCAADDTRDTDPGVCQYTIVGTEFDPTFTDNCSDGFVTNDLNGTSTLAGQILPKGDTTVLWTADDGNGQTATCTTVITVEDNENPVISCAADDIRDTDPGVCQYTVVGTEFNATFTDNCADGFITNDLNGTATIAGEILPTGTTTVVWTVDDGNGQNATCTTIITVEDNEAPIISCPADLNANTDPTICGAVVFFPDAIALDNCGVASVVQTAGLPSGSLFPVGVSTIEYTATDVNGNTTTCDFTITVTDNEAPIAVCQDITIQLDASGNAMIVAADVDGGSTDNCAIDTISIDMDTFDCSNVGPNNVTLSVTDVNGNTGTCIAVVTVEDVTAPVVVCQNITVELDVNGTVTIAGIDVDGGSTDACGIASYDLDQSTFDCSNVGTNDVILTVTDVNGNVSTCTAVVTVEDNISSDLVCMDFTLELGADGTAILTPNDVIASNDDACGIFTTAVDITNFDCSDIGTPVTVQVFSEDNNGNLSTCFATVTVVDLLAPELTCPLDQTQDPGVGNLFYEVPDYFATGEATAIDNCTDPVTILTQDPAAGTLLADGIYTITMTAEDAYGNVSTCTFELTIDSILGVSDTEISLETVVMYPNPATDYVMISNPQALNLEQATIYDLNGRVIRTINLKDMGTEKMIDVTELASANYIVLIQGEKGQMTKQLLKN